MRNKFFSVKNTRMISYAAKFKLSHQCTLKQTQRNPDTEAPPFTQENFLMESIDVKMWDLLIKCSFCSVSTVHVNLLEANSS